MTEERERYDWETEDGTGTAARGQEYTTETEADRVDVLDARYTAMQIQVMEMGDRLALMEQEREEALLALGARVNDLAWKIERQDDVLDILRRHLNKLQDANIAPMLESSAVIVQLTRIADAMGRQTVIAEALLPIHQATAEQTERATRVIETRHASADTDDCDELWRLAREYVASLEGPPPNPNAIHDALLARDAIRDAFLAFVRERTP